MRAAAVVLAALVTVSCNDIEDTSAPPCRAGFERQGDQCADIDECAADNGGCGAAERGSFGPIPSTLRYRSVWHFKRSRSTRLLAPSTSCDLLIIFGSIVATSFISGVSR